MSSEQDQQDTIRSLLSDLVEVLESESESLQAKFFALETAVQGSDISVQDVVRAYAASQTDPLGILVGEPRQQVKDLCEIAARQGYDISLEGIEEASGLVNNKDDVIATGYHIYARNDLLQDEKRYRLKLLVVRSQAIGIDISATELVDAIQQREDLSSEDAPIASGVDMYPDEIGDSAESAGEKRRVDNEPAPVEADSASDQGTPIEESSDETDQALAEDNPSSSPSSGEHHDSSTGTQVAESDTEPPSEDQQPHQSAGASVEEVDTDAGGVDEDSAKEGESEDVSHEWLEDAVEFWGCPYCEYAKEKTTSVRQHINARSSDRAHAGREGWSNLEHHLPGYDEDELLIAGFERAAGDGSGEIKPATELDPEFWFTDDCRSASGTVQPTQHTGDELSAGRYPIVSQGREIYEAHKNGDEGGHGSPEGIEVGKQDFDVSENELSDPNTAFDTVETPPEAQEIEGFGSDRVPDGVELDPSVTEDTTETPADGASLNEDATDGMPDTEQQRPESSEVESQKSSTQSQTVDDRGGADANDGGHSPADEAPVQEPDEQTEAQRVIDPEPTIETEDETSSADQSADQFSDWGELSGKEAADESADGDVTIETDTNASASTDNTTDPTQRKTETAGQTGDATDTDSEPDIESPSVDPSDAISWIEIGGDMPEQGEGVTESDTPNAETSTDSDTSSNPEPSSSGSDGESQVDEAALERGFEFDGWHIQNQADAIQYAHDLYQRESLSSREKSVKLKQLHRQSLQADITIDAQKIIESLDTLRETESPGEAVEEISQEGSDATTGTGGTSDDDGQSSRSGEKSPRVMTPVGPADTPGELMDRLIELVDQSEASDSNLYAKLQRIIQDAQASDIHIDMERVLDAIDRHCQRAFSPPQVSERGGEREDDISPRISDRQDVFDKAVEIMEDNDRSGKDKKDALRDLLKLATANGIDVDPNEVVQRVQQRTATSPSPSSRTAENPEDPSEGGTERPPTRADGSASGDSTEGG